MSTRKDEEDVVTTRFCCMYSEREAVGDQATTRRG